MLPYLRQKTFAKLVDHICSLCTYWWVLEKVIVGQLLWRQPNGYKVTYIVWCESTVVKETAQWL